MKLQTGDMVRYRSHPDKIVGFVTRKGTNGWVKVAWMGFPYTDTNIEDFTGYTACHCTELDLVSKNDE
jgi:hypothetical protein